MPAFVHEESHYMGYDGIRMFMHLWRPEDDRPRALFIAIHGLGSHGGDMFTIGEYLAERGIAVFAPDMRGFGHFKGLKGHVMSHDEYIEDIQNIVMQVKDRYLNKLTYLMGASLGGISVIRYSALHTKDIDGLVLQCPGVSQKLPISLPLRIAGEILSLLNVKYYTSSGVPLSDGCRDPEVVKRHEEDPLRVPEVTARFGISGLQAAKKGWHLAEAIKLPVLVQQAGDDNLVSPERNKEFFDRISAKDKTWRLYEGLYHEIHEEPEKEIVLQDIYSWLEARLPR
ncbi:MAG: alpha/beta hydrolase [Candidatus Thorarchaeota archaeon]